MSCFEALEGHDVEAQVRRRLLLHRELGHKVTIQEVRAERQSDIDEIQDLLLAALLIPASRQ